MKNEILDNSFDNKNHGRNIVVIAIITFLLFLLFLLFMIIFTLLKLKYSEVITQYEFLNENIINLFSFIFTLFFIKNIDYKNTPIKKIFIYPFLFTYIVIVLINVFNTDIIDVYNTYFLDDPQDKIPLSWAFQPTTSFFISQFFNSIIGAFTMVYLIYDRLIYRQIDWVFFSIVFLIILLITYLF